MRSARVIEWSLRCAWALVALSPTGCRKIEPMGAGAGGSAAAKSSLEMVLIPEGEFQMGSDQEDDETAHHVSVNSFYMDRCEVTQEEYERVVGKNPSRWKGRQNPVEQIRWADAVNYCNARSRAEGLEPAYDVKTRRCNYTANGYRLPTEAEWEYAARAGTNTAYFFGDGKSKLPLFAWFKENSTRGPHPVGRKEPNPWGLHDMYGNVWEWCGDFYQEDYYQHSPAKNPQGPEAGKSRVVRGGCWNSRPDACRSSYRSFEDPGYTDVCFAKDIHGFIGFRCVRPHR